MNRTTLIFLIALFLTPSSFILSAPPQWEGRLRDGPTNATAPTSRDQGPSSKYKELIKKFDKNGDGRLDERERSNLRIAIAEKRVEAYGKRTWESWRRRNKEVDPFTRRHDPYAPHRSPRYRSPKDSHPRYRSPKDSHPRNSPRRRNRQ